MRLSDETIGRFAWQERALCAGRPLAEFFPSGKPQSDLKKLCGGCDVRVECLAFALQTGAEGIWGGTSTRERRRRASMDVILQVGSSTELSKHSMAS